MDSPSIIFKYFHDLDEIQKSRFSRLGDLYNDWNSKINVISRKDMDSFYERHVLHSLGIAKVTKFKPGSRILDVGTGGGFPGIPLAILYPDTEFHLVDSIGKKIRVVNEVATALGLENIIAKQQRAENVEGTYDFIVSRAVTRMNTFLGWTKGKVRPAPRNELKNGILYLKGGDLTEEMAEVGRPFELYELTDYFQEEFFETKMVVHLTI